MTQPAGATDTARSGAGIARGAMLIAGLTIVSRILGLVRTLVFSQTIGADCLGTSYVTANQVPNLVYELVLGGALTSAMVPVLARSAERSGSDPAEKARVGQITSALLTWSVIILVPLTLAIAAAAGPVASALNPVNAHAHCPRADMVATTASMLQVFAPQALLYGLSVVLYGLLQAYRRFTGPTIGPAVSSLVLIAAYLSFVPLAKGLPLARLPLQAELVLSVGTTLGVAALVVVGVVPAWRLHLRLRPTLRFPPGVARRASGLALVGVAELIAIDAASLVAIALANGRGETGAIVIFNYASQVFNTLSGVLAISIVTSAFPVLSARDGPVFARTCAGSARAVLLMSWLGAAVIAAVAMPTAHVLARQPDQVPQLIEAFALFAPGIAGTAVIAILSRAMLAIGRLKVAAVAVAGSWVLVMVADVVLAELAPARLVVAALALGNTIGQTVVAVPLVLVTGRICGRDAIAGTGHAMLAGLAAGAAGAAVGVGVSLADSGGGKLLAVGVAVAAAACSVLAFGAVAFLLDRGDLRAIVRRARRMRRAADRRG
ncbi:MAG TPA: lipid II flippase MurJ [Streptosporangiaceae bacterium]|nr:lipid II flippase MurJ [Streptosporangiaceae bacterium]